MRDPKRFCPLCGGELSAICHHGRDRHFCRPCDTIHYENPLPATAALVFNGDGQLLLVKRGMDPGKGLWCLPGGFLETDEGPAEGILRELKEETGLGGEVEGLIDVVYEDSAFYGPLIIIGYTITPQDGAVQAGDDAIEAEYFPLHELPHIAFDSHQTLIQKVKGIRT